MKIYEIFEKIYTSVGPRFDSLGLYCTEEGARRALEIKVRDRLWKCKSTEEVKKEINTLERSWSCYCSPRTGIVIRIHHTKD